MVDLTFLEKFTKGDTTKMQRYISLYLEVAPKTFTEMQKNLKDKDWNQLRINAHSLKPQTEFMGITTLKNVLIKIEESVNSAQVDKIENLVEESLRIHEESANKLLNLLKRATVEHPKK